MFTMLATSKNGQFLGHNHLLTTDTDDLTLRFSPERQLSLYLWAILGDQVNRHSLPLTKHAANEHGGWVKTVQTASKAHGDGVNCEGTV